MEHETATTQPEQHAMLITKHLRPQRGGALRRDDARNLLRRTIEYHVSAKKLVVLAWVVTPCKVSMLIAMPTPRPITDALGELFGYYTRRFNARYNQEGSLFRVRFLKKMCSGAEEIRQAIERLHRIPEEMVLTGRPGSEAWSSADVYRQGVPDAITTVFHPPSMEATL